MSNRWQNHNFRTKQSKSQLEVLLTKIMENSLFTALALITAQHRHVYSKQTEIMSIRLAHKPSFIQARVDRDNLKELLCLLPSRISIWTIGGKR